MNTNKKILCKNCGFENLEGTNYCQKCGKKLIVKNKFIKSLDFGSVSGTGAKGVSVAPLAAKAISNEAGKIKQNKNKIVKVIPLKDGSWHCPDCGQLNKPYSLYCKGCGRDI
jgi:predicted amidophosphoribosyltransferase